MNEWMAFFGPIPDILEPVVTEDSPPVILPVDSSYVDMNNYLSLFFKDEEGTPFHCNEEALKAIQTCLELALESIIDDCDAESLQRTKGKERVLVPALLNGVAKRNPYLKFISNVGLQKPEYVY